MTRIVKNQILKNIIVLSLITPWYLSAHEVCECENESVDEHKIEEHTSRTWSASAEFGVIDTSGNTEGTLGKLKVNFEHDGNIFRNTFEFDSLYKKDEQTIEVTLDTDGDGDGELDVTEIKEKKTTDNKYNFAWQTNYKLEKPTDFDSDFYNGDDEGDEYANQEAIFVRLAYDRNHFSSYEYQGSFSVGYNTRLLRSDNAYLDLSIGPGIGFQSVIVEENIVDAQGNEVTIEQNEDDAFAQLFLAAKYERKISDTSYFAQSVIVEGAHSENTKTVAETSVRASINGSLALKASVQFTHNSDVEDGFENTDTVIGATFVYSF